MKVPSFFPIGIPSGQGGDFPVGIPMGRGGLNKDLTSFYTNDFKATSPDPS